MPVSFAHIPPGIRVPLFYAEISNTQAGYEQQNQVALLIGPMTDPGTGEINEPTLVVSASQAATLFGAGSVLAQMVEAYRANDNFGELWCIAQDNAVGAGPATASIEFTGTATAAGQVSLYIQGQLSRIPVSKGDDGPAIAAKIEAAITALPFCPVTAVVGGGLGRATASGVDFTAKQPGVLGNEIDIQLNYRGLAGGETTPAGITAVITPMAGGTGQTDLADAITAMGDDPYDFIAIPYTDGDSLDQIQDLMNDVAGRWAWDRQIYGHVFSAKRSLDGGQDLVTFGRSRNDPHCTVLGFGNSPTSSWQRAAALCGEAASSLRIDPARPLQTLPLVGAMPPPRGERFTVSMLNTLLYSGIATEMQVAGQVYINRCITTYQQNQWGQPDPSYLDVQTPFTLMLIVRTLRERITQKFPRSKLADDGTPYGAGQAVVTPSVIRAELIATYGELEAQAICENLQAFKQFLIVERDINDPNRVNVLFPPDLVNQLRVVATLVEFRLQYQTAALAA
jgi:phage tail sheath gpL-like